MGSVWTIVVAAGSGSRFGGAKQYERLGDRRVIDWSLGVARAATDGVVAVVAEAAPVEAAADRTVIGGATRSASVRSGLAAVPAEADVIVVHDAARPLASSALFAAVIEAVRAGADAALPGVAVTDTVRRRDGEPVDRDELVAVQTPQAFAAERLRGVHAGEPEATDDASLIEADGGTVVVVAGEAKNAKITSADDLLVAAALLGSTGMSLHVGQGYDVHPFSDDPARPLVLGGVTVEGAPGLAGHSDADALAHACADAVLGAAGLGDLGDHFPDTEPRWAGADSLTLLAEVVGLAADAGWRVVNLDATVVAERPRLGHRRAEMAERLAAVVGAPVSVKATTHEGLGALGRGEGVACLAVALLETA